MAVAQTRHEWCRLLYLSKAANGLAGTAVPIGLMVDPTKSPHPSNTPCAPLEEGPIEVTITPTRVRILDDLDSESPGEINLVFTLFTDNFRRSIRTQAAPFRCFPCAFFGGRLLSMALLICWANELDQSERPRYFYQDTPIW